MNNQIPENTSKNTHNIVAQLLLEDNECKKVLDIPSGAGAFTNRLLEKGIEVHSADIENIMMVENKNFQAADMNKRLPFEDNFFCSVVCIDGIEHIERPFDFVRECYRVLKPGGCLLISTPNISSLRSRWRWFWTGHHNKCKSPLNELNPTPLHHINMISYPEIRYLLHTNKFQINKVATNRVKGISYVYSLFTPISYFFTRFVYSKEERAGEQKAKNKEILSNVFSKQLLYGETMIVKARALK